MNELNNINLDEILTLVSKAKSTMDTKNNDIKGNVKTALSYINKQENITDEQKQFINTILNRVFETLGN